MLMHSFVVAYFSIKAETLDVILIIVALADFKLAIDVAASSGVTSAYWC